MKLELGEDVGCCETIGHVTWIEERPRRCRRGRHGHVQNQKIMTNDERGGGRILKFENLIERRSAKILARGERTSSVPRWGPCGEVVGSCWTQEEIVRKWIERCVRTESLVNQESNFGEI